MKKCANLICLAVLFEAAHAAGAPRGGPSRVPIKGCAWEKLSDAKVGLEAWVERCDFGFRKIDLLFVGSSLSVRYSDGGGLEPLVDVLDLLPDETPEAGVERLFAARTEKGLVNRCVMAAYRDTKARSGVKRFTFVPNAAYQKELDAKADPNEVPDPPCGGWGTTPDGIQYFEAQPASGARKVLFVRVGQDEPLFDEKTLRLLPP
ncbi:MAG: hypothetical protein ACHQJD_00140 [Thermoanaerobaculia bacterium]